MVALEISFMILAVLMILTYLLFCVTEWFINMNSLVLITLENLETIVSSLAIFIVALKLHSEFNSSSFDYFVSLGRNDIPLKE